MSFIEAVLQMTLNGILRYRSGFLQAKLS